MKKDRREALRTLIDTLGVHPIDIGLLDLALTHPSYATENRLGVSNQRLEFLGDAVVDLIMGEYLYFTFPDYDEGVLSKMRASLVCEDALAQAALALGLDKYLLLGHGESLTGGATRPSNLADAWEAMCGAIYLSAGIDALKPVAIQYLEHSIASVKDGYYGDYKTRFQEFIQKEPNHLISYMIIEELGPAHAKEFVVDVLVDNKPYGRGKGKSKKLAEREAAKAALIALNELPPLGK